jgi:hypothetical protein
LKKRVAVLRRRERLQLKQQENLQRTFCKLENLQRIFCRLENL